MDLRLKELRKSKGLNQQDVADILGVSRQGYNKYELGQRELGYDFQKKLADFYDVSIDYLLGHETEYSVQKNESPFALAYGHLFSDENFNRYAKIYSILSSDQQKILLGYVLGFAEQCGISYKDIG